MHFQIKIYHNKSSYSVRLQFLLISWKLTRVIASFPFFAFWKTLKKDVKGKWDFVTWLELVQNENVNDAFTFC